MFILSRGNTDENSSQSPAYCSGRAKSVKSTRIEELQIFSLEYILQPMRPFETRESGTTGRGRARESQKMSFSGIKTPSECGSGSEGIFSLESGRENSNIKAGGGGTFRRGRRACNMCRRGPPLHNAQRPAYMVPYLLTTGHDTHDTKHRQPKHRRFDQQQ